MIHYNSINKIFNLKMNELSYHMRVDDLGYLEHLYWGKSIDKFSGHSLYPNLDRGYSTNMFETSDRSISLEHKFLELSTYGNGDFGESSLILRLDNGVYVNDFRYHSHKIYKEKLMMNDLPSSFGEGESLKITLKDHYLDVYVHLYYHVFKDSNSLSRHIELDNQTDLIIHIEKALSMNIDLFNNEYDYLCLPGMWAQERNIKRHKIGTGSHHIDSKRGTSSHYMAPFIAILDSDSNLNQGDVYSLNLMYSGSFSIIHELNSIDQIRLQAGIQALDNQIVLNPNETFITPEVILSYSNKGLNGIMKEHHDFVNHHIIQKDDQVRQRPVLINNWEATYFDFNEEKLLEIAKSAKKSGIELFVLDDGWFGKRNDDTSSLGDWVLNHEKLPKGLKSLADKIHGLDMKFGLWIEPEMISMESDLYRKYPKYLMRDKERDPIPSRSQYVLDFGSSEVVDHIYHNLCAVFDNLNLDYVKWDMNRPLVEQYSMLQDKTSPNIEYVKGFYRLIKMLKKRYPKILFEACAGGGGRFDWGVLNYFPQVWTSDNTDAIERLKIQEGSILLFPQKSMGAHVSDVPNHQTGRSTSLDMRFHVAAPFNLGYELDLSKLSNDTLREVETHVTWYKKNRVLLQNGRFYYLKSPCQDNQKALMIVNEMQTEAIVFVYQVLSSFNDRLWRMKLDGLKAKGIYEMNGLTYSGEELMNYGFYLSSEMNQDSNSMLVNLKLMEEN